MANSNEDAPTPEMMLMFYDRLFPYAALFKWLNHAPTPTRQWTHREISFELVGGVHIRWHSFNNVEAFKKQLCAFNPTRFELGAVYSARPRDKKTIRPALFQPVLRELVFDIDMTDYDPVRTCCSDAGICQKCWGFIAAAVKVLDRAVREEFGYEKLLWVYSGRRGIHLWISDKEAMELTDAQRKALVGWMMVVYGGKDNAKKPNVTRNGGRLAPSLQHALDYLKTIFGQLILSTQDCFREEKGWEELLKAIPDTRVVDTLRSNWKAKPNLSSEDKWHELLQHRASSKTLAPALEDIIIQYTYPRLDQEVTKKRNHLLKSPFCVHPKTGRICIPVDPAKVDSFDPASVPTLGQLLAELDAIPRKATAENTDSGSAAAAPGTGEICTDWEHTSLKPYVEMLSLHGTAMMQDARKDKTGTGGTLVSSAALALLMNH